MTLKSKAFGKIGEEYSRKYLVSRGYDIIFCNYRTPVGEIDIIAKEKDTFVFVEVKTRKSNKKGYPEESVNIRKYQKIKKNIDFYFFNCKNTTSTNLLSKSSVSTIKYRIDVISVIINNNKVEYFRHIKNAFY